MKEIWYQTRDWATEDYLNPKEVEVHKESDEFIWINGSRHAKSSEYAKYFKTKSEVIEHHVRRWEKTVTDLEDRLRFAKEKLATLKEKL